MFISQSTYTKELPKRFSLENTKPISTSIKLVKDESEEKINEKMYLGMIGCLLYLKASSF